MRCLNDLRHTLFLLQIYKFICPPSIQIHETTYWYVICTLLKDMTFHNLSCALAMTEIRNCKEFNRDILTVTEYKYMVSAKSSGWNILLGSAMRNYWNGIKSIILIKNMCLVPGRSALMCVFPFSEYDFIDVWLIVNPTTIWSRIQNFILNNSVKCISIILTQHFL